MPVIDIDLALKNLLMTQKYCNVQMQNLEKNPAAILRSFNPQYSGKNLFSYSLDKISNDNHQEYYYIETTWSIDPVRQTELIPALYQQQLQHKENYTYPSNVQEWKGEIFACYLHETLIDGAAEVSSYGLLDRYNYPPVDTWFYLGESSKGPILLAWIPEPFTAYANEGIAVNPEECINWFKNWYPDEYKNLVSGKNAGILSSIKKISNWFSR